VAGVKSGFPVNVFLVKSLTLIVTWKRGRGKEEEEAPAARCRACGIFAKASPVPRHRSSRNRFREEPRSDSRAGARQLQYRGATMELSSSTAIVSTWVRRGKTPAIPLVNPVSKRLYYARCLRTRVLAITTTNILITSILGSRARLPRGFRVTSPEARDLGKGKRFSVPSALSSGEQCRNRQTTLRAGSLNNQGTFYFGTWLHCCLMQ